MLVGGWWCVCLGCGDGFLAEGCEGRCEVAGLEGRGLEEVGWDGIEVVVLREGETRVGTWVVIC